MFDEHAVCSIEAEQALIGCVLVDNRAFDKTPGGFSADCFHDKVHARLWAAIAKRITEGQSVSVFTLKTLFADDDGLYALGGGAYLASLISIAIAPSAANEHATMIMEMAERRNLTDICREGIAAASKPDSDYRQVRFQIEAALASKESQVGEDAAVWLSDSVRQARYDISEAAHNGVSMSGIPIHVPAADEIIGGLRPSKLAILAGRPSMGKTALALWTAIRTAQNGIGVYFISREMAPEELSHRAMSMISAQMQEPVDYERMPRTDQLTGRELAAITRASVQLQGLPFLIAPRHVQSVGGILSDIRRAERKLADKRAPLGLIVVDYLQLLRTDGGRRENRTVEIGEISRSLKEMAMRLNLPVMALSQLSRQVEQRDDKRPQMSDLRESGGIEQDADMVIFAFREDYYVSRLEPRENTPEHLEWKMRLEECRGTMEVIINKNRGGRLGIAKTQAQLRTNSFL